MKKAPKNFRGIYAIPADKMSREQLFAYLKHEYSIGIGVGPQTVSEFASREELLKRVEEEDSLAWNDYREKLISAENPKAANGDVPASR